MNGYRLIPPLDTPEVVALRRTSVPVFQTVPGRYRPGDRLNAPCAAPWIIVDPSGRRYDSFLSAKNAKAALRTLNSGAAQ